MGIDRYPDEPCPICGFDEWMLEYQLYDDEDTEVHKYFCFNCGFNSVMARKKQVEL